MASILHVADDVWFAVFQCVEHLDLLSISQTCIHFHNLTDATKYSHLNRYWKQKCEQLWPSLIKENISNINSKHKNYNYKPLFISMIKFILSSRLGDLTYICERGDPNAPFYSYIKYGYARKLNFSNEKSIKNCNEKNEQNHHRIYCLDSLQFLIC